VHLHLFKIVRKMMQVGYGQAFSTMIQGKELLVVYYGWVFARSMLGKNPYMSLHDMTLLLDLR
jgi:hypothetical protein